MSMSSLTDSPRFVKQSAGSMEHCQNQIMEQNFQQHQLAASKKKGSGMHANLNAAAHSSFRRNNSASSDTASVNTPLLLGSSSRPNSIPSSLEYYGGNPHQAPQQQSPPQSPTFTTERNIRFQVVVWYIGTIDMIQGRVPVTFRITLFWNDTPMNDDEELLDDETMSQSSRSHSVRMWKMRGRQQAVMTEQKDESTTAVNVPAVSILNVVTFDTIGAPEVSLLREDTKLMRWTCMYRATLIQEHWRVDNFPHDEHSICLKLAILANRKQGETWDRHVWSLGLATAEDSQGSTRIPHGLVVDQVAIPEFNHNRKQGLSFRFVPLDYGAGGGQLKDKCLEVNLKVIRDSSYYDKNIMPLLGLLNLVAVSITALEAQDFFQRGLLTLNIAFVEIGIRMTTDKHLPSVSYQIKMQRILNEYFYGLLFLVLESLFVYVLKVRFNISWTGYIDALAAFTALFHNIFTQVTYYNDAKRIKKKIMDVSTSPKPQRRLSLY